MTPIKARDFLSHPRKLHRPRAVLDLREFNLVHAAPVEDDHAILTMRYDPKTGGLVPIEPQQIN